MRHGMRRIRSIRMQLDFGNLEGDASGDCAGMRVPVQRATPVFFDENFFKKEDGWWTRARGAIFFEKQDVELVLFRAAGCPFVPWHAGDEHSHAAPIRGARKDKARANESREPDECRIDKLGQESTGEDEKAGRDAHLALQRDHAGDTPIHWKACRRPRRGSALDHAALFKA